MGCLIQFFGGWQWPVGDVESLSRLRAHANFTALLALAVQAAATYLLIGNIVGYDDDVGEWPTNVTAACVTW